MPFVVPRTESMLYDGTNPEAAAEWAKARFVSVDDTGRLTFEISANYLVYEVTADPGWWITRFAGVGSACSPEDYERNYYELPST